MTTDREYFNRNKLFKDKEEDERLKKECIEMRIDSGHVDSSDRSVCFMYLLCRDHLPTGVVENIIIQMNNNDDEKFEFTNGWLAKYAMDIVRRLNNE